MPLLEISNLLQRRQIYFGLIVIERATGLEFGIPEFIPGEDIDSISFTYHASVARDFGWLCNDVTLFMPATEESLTWINNLPTTEPGGVVYKVRFGPTPKSRTIFGQTVALGDETVFLDDAIVQNHGQVLRKLALSDGQIVLGCINLEAMLDERLAARYNELAASTLAGLTQEKE